MKRIFILCAAVLLLTSCKTTTQYVPVAVHTTDTLTKVFSRWDTIYVRDSISTDRTSDTVRIERWHTKYVERQTHDTIYQATHDTIPQPYPVEVVKEVEKRLSWLQRTLMYIGILAVGLSIIYGGIFFVKRKFKI